MSSLMFSYGATDKKHSEDDKTCLAVHVAAVNHTVLQARGAITVHGSCSAYLGDKLSGSGEASSQGDP